MCVHVSRDAQLLGDIHTRPAQKWHVPSAFASMMFFALSAGVVINGLSFSQSPSTPSARSNGALPFVFISNARGRKSRTMKSPSFVTRRP